MQKSHSRVAAPADRGKSKRPATWRGPSNRSRQDLFLLFLAVLGHLDGALVPICVFAGLVDVHRRRADILVAAVGRPEMVKADWVKPGAVVIDVGINRVEDASKKSGYRLTGDVAYEEVAPRCAAITPVPGGVGPMTIAMLMKNTLQAARQLG